MRRANALPVRRVTPARAATTGERSIIGAQRERLMFQLRLGLWLLAAAMLLPGCAVIGVAGAAAGAAISVTGAVVSTGVKVTGKAIEKTIDVVTPGGGSN